MKTIIGLTGPTGAGKSEAARIAAEFGAQVIDCDQVARRAVFPGMPGLIAVAEAFGADVIGTDGTLDRKRLAAKAFASSEQTEKLNRTLLPYIVRLCEEEMTGGRVLLDAPTLFESGMASRCDATVAVLADPGIRLNRIISRDGLTLTEARLRLSAGKPDEFYLERADHILYNNADAGAFFSNARALFNKLFGGNENGSRKKCRSNSERGTVHGT